jgi:hypothetical protein
MVCGNHDERWEDFKGKVMSFQDTRVAQMGNMQDYRNEPCRENTTKSSRSDSMPTANEIILAFMNKVPRSYYGWGPDTEDELRPIFQKAEEWLSQNTDEMPGAHTQKWK